MSGNKKKVAIVTAFYPPANLSGSTLLNKQIAEFLGKNGYRVTVITSDAFHIKYWGDILFNKFIAKKNDTINGIRVIRLKHHPLMSSFLYILFKYLGFILPKQIKNKIEIMYQGPYINQKNLEIVIQKGNFDTIYCSTLPFFLNIQVAEIIRNLTAKPKFIFRSDLHPSLPVYHNPFLKKIYSCANLLQVFTLSEKKELKKIFKINGKKLEIIPATINSHLQDINSVEIMNFKKKYGLNDKKIVLFAGMRNYYKGALFLLKTIKNLYKKDPSLILISIGPNEKEWNFAKILEGQGCLLDLGFVSDRLKQIVFKSCDIFCLPSIAESFGITYLEAWLEKKPVIGAKIPSSQELIEKNKGGLCVDFNNVEQLEKTIVLLTNDKNLSRFYGENGYKAVRLKYNFDKNSGNYLKLFT